MWSLVKIWLTLVTRVEAEVSTTVAAITKYAAHGRALKSEDDLMSNPL